MSAFFLWKVGIPIWKAIVQHNYIRGQKALWPLKHAKIANWSTAAAAQKPNICSSNIFFRKMWRVSRAYIFWCWWVWVLGQEIPFVHISAMEGNHKFVSFCAFAAETLKVFELPEVKVEVGKGVAYVGRELPCNESIFWERRMTASAAIALCQNDYKA